MLEALLQHPRLDVNRVCGGLTALERHVHKIQPDHTAEYPFSSGFRWVDQAVAALLMTDRLAIHAGGDSAVSSSLKAAHYPLFQALLSHSSCTLNTGAEELKVDTSGSDLIARRSVLSEREGPQGKHVVSVFLAAAARRLHSDNVKHGQTGLWLHVQEEHMAAITGKSLLNHLPPGCAGYSANEHEVYISDDAEELAIDNDNSDSCKQEWLEGSIEVSWPEGGVWYVPKGESMPGYSRHTRGERAYDALRSEASASNLWLVRVERPEGG